MTNNNTTQKAIVATIQLGHIEFEGLLLPDSSYGIAVSQVWDLFHSDIGIPAAPRNTAQSLKRLIGREFQQAQKIKIPDLQFGKDRSPRLVISLWDFEYVVAKLDRAGNKKAQTFRDDMVGLSLRQLFADAFGEKFEQEERQDWLIKRQATKVTFRDMTDELKQYGFKDKHDYAKFVAILQNKLGIPSGTRDIQDLETLNNLEIVQAKIATYIECGKTPWEALKSI